MARHSKKRKNPRLEVNPGAGWWILGGVVVVGGLVAWKMLDVADDAFKSMTSEAKKKGNQIPDRTTPTDNASGNWEDFPLSPDIYARFEDATKDLRPVGVSDYFNADGRGFLWALFYNDDSQRKDINTILVVVRFYSDGSGLAPDYYYGPAMTSPESVGLVKAMIAEDAFRYMDDAWLVSNGFTQKGITESIDKAFLGFES